MRTSWIRVVLPLLGLLTSSSLRGAENPVWNNLKQLGPGQQVRVVLDSKKSFKGQFQSVTDDAIIVHANGADQTLSRFSVQEVSLIIVRVMRVPGNPLIKGTFWLDDVQLAAGSTAESNR